MKQFLGTVIALTCSLGVQAQYLIKGIVSDEANRPLEQATVSLQKGGVNMETKSTDGDGYYEFKGLTEKGIYEIVAAHISMKKRIVEANVTDKITFANISLNNYTYFLEPLEVISLRASEKSPFAKTNITAKELAKNNTGQDLPFLLNQTPSVVVNSDAGNGIGYTGIRIRGSDATRINTTVNGIPYNDAESQGTYFVDLPDIASSVNSIQIQRGVGTSSNGAGAFGASINLSTNEFNESAYGEINNSFGSFNSWKNTVKAGSGLINKHFTADVRLSSITSDGFIDRAATNLKSLYFSTAYIGDKSTVRFNIILGKEKTYQAWNGVSESMLAANRTYNSAGTEKPGEPYNNETDNYQQDHYQLFFNHSFNNQLSFNTAFFLSKGRGYYEQYKGVAAETAAGSTSATSFENYGLPNPVFGNDTVTNTDLVRQLWLDNKYYGQIFSLHYKTTKDQITVGGGWNQYKGSHYGTIIWAETSIPKDYQWYNLDAVKTDVNVYGKWEHSLSRKLNVYTDLQYRKVGYDMNGFEHNPSIIVNREFNFINPKAGLTYSFNGLQTYFSYALANKEPNRDDFEAGIINQPRFETLHDFELGAEKRNVGYSFGITGYYMLYNNQLILTGKINDVGAYTRVNVAASYRAGIELQARANMRKWINAAANLTFSKNKIRHSGEYIDDYDNGGQQIISHQNTDISFSPSVIGGFTVNLLPFKNTELSFLGKYVSRQYLDNTQNTNRSLRPYFVQDVRFSYSIKNKLFKEVNIIASVYNLLNYSYEANGYTFSYIYSGKTTTENYYFPMAGTNIMAGINIKL